MRIRHALSAAAMTIALVACGGEAEVNTTTEAETGSDTAATPVVHDTVTGGQIDLGALEGQDTVLWFWAPW